MRGVRGVVTALAGCAAIGLGAATAWAGPPGFDGPGRGPGWGRGPDGPGRPAHMGAPDAWHSGRWVHDWWDGRYGWWWIVGGTRYFYPAPVYPYPAPMVPPGVVVVAAAPQAAYYCANPAGYYPAVPQCLAPWQTVPLPAAAPAPVAAPAPASSGGIDKTTGGTLLGAVGGGVAGAQFGQGSGRVAAAVVGTILGAFVGHEVGQSLDRADALAAQQAAQQAYVAPIGQSIAWNASSTGHAGTITPTREGRDAQNNVCREFKQTVAIDGRQTEVTSTACRKPDGTWVQIGS